MQLVEYCKAWEAKFRPPKSMAEEFPDAGAAMSSVPLYENLVATQSSSEKSKIESLDFLHKTNETSAFANPFFDEIIVLVKRSWKNIKRTPELFWMRLVTVMITGFVLATIFWHLDHTPMGVQVRQCEFLGCVSLPLLNTCLLNQTDMKLNIQQQRGTKGKTHSLS